MRATPTLPAILLASLPWAHGCTARASVTAEPDAALAATPDAGPSTGWPDTGPRPDAGDSLDDVIVLAHSSRELYAFDPRSLDVALVGTLRLADETPVVDLTDLAIDRDGAIVGTTFTDLYAIDGVTAIARRIGSLGLPTETRFNALTFVPVGVLDPYVEVLIAATAGGELFRVDRATGAAARIGAFGDGWGSSGDIVSVREAGTFATVTRADHDSDVLARLDPATGEVTPIGRGTEFSRLFGLGYWRNRLYGFSTLGLLLELDPDTGEGRSLARSGAIYWGAGVTTLAPTAPF